MNHRAAKIGLLFAVIPYSLLHGCQPDKPDHSLVKREAKPEFLYCGGKVRFSVAERYFESLRKALADGASPKDFNPFVYKSLSVIRDRKYLAYNTAEIGAVTPSKISISDWRQISKRGATRLDLGSWRGCMFDNGKAWFQGDGSEFRLSAINHDMRWMATEVQ